jgi:hypothetical protein
LWHSITIKIPAELVEYNKKGKVLIKKTLTKQFNISKFQKKPAIKLIPSESNKVEIVNQGTDFNNKEETPIENKINVHLDSNKKIKIKKQDLPENIETKIIVPMESNKKVKIKN